MKINGESDNGSSGMYRKARKKAGGISA